MVNQDLAIGDYRQAASVAQVALRNPGISPALTADLFVMQAEAFALMGDTKSAYEAMNRAEKEAARIAMQNEPNETSYVQVGLIELKIIEALLYIGDLRPATSFLDHPVDPATHPRGQVNRLATMATLAARSDDADRAALLAIDMVERAQGMESHRLNERFRKLRTALSKMGSKVTKDAIERIDRTLTLLP